METPAKNTPQPVSPESLNEKPAAHTKKQIISVVAIVTFLLLIILFILFTFGERHNQSTQTQQGNTIQSISITPQITVFSTGKADVTYKKASFQTFSLSYPSQWLVQTINTSNDTESVSIMASTNTLPSLILESRAADSPLDMETIRQALLKRQYNQTTLTTKTGAFSILSGVTQGSLVNGRFDNNKRQDLVALYFHEDRAYQINFTYQGDAVSTQNEDIFQAILNSFTLR